MQPSKDVVRLWWLWLIWRPSHHSPHFTGSVKRSIRSSFDPFPTYPVQGSKNALEQNPVELPVSHWANDNAALSDPMPGSWTLSMLEMAYLIFLLLFLSDIGGLAVKFSCHHIFPRTIVQLSCAYTQIQLLTTVTVNLMPDVFSVIHSHI